MQGARYRREELYMSFKEECRNASPRNNGNPAVNPPRSRSTPKSGINFPDERFRMSATPCADPQGHEADDLQTFRPA